MSGPATATTGPDIVAAFFPRAGGAPNRAGVKSLTAASGVVAHSGPYPVIPTVLEANGRTVLAQTQGRDTEAGRGRPAQDDRGRLGPRPAAW